MARPLLSLSLCMIASIVMASPAALAARAGDRLPLATPPPSGERVVIGPDGADMHEIARGHDGLFYVHADVNGARIRFLIDTGANYVVLTGADARRLGLGPRRYDAKLATAGGRAQMAWTTLDHVEVAGRTVSGLRAAIMRDGLDVSLLGQNLLSQLDHVTIEGNRLRMR